MWREQRCIGVEWKITNFVTLGSPLAHASFLMADGPSDLAERVSQREFPTCPPQPNDARDIQYGKPLLVAKNGGTLLHHAALFACTRWTNLYFEKDIIGGAIEDLGHGINNRRLEPRGFFPHTKYWSPHTDPKPLREALARNSPMSVEEIADCPLFITGSGAEIRDTLERRRERTGISYVVIQGKDPALLETFAEAIVAPLAGR